MPLGNLVQIAPGQRVDVVQFSCHEVMRTEAAVWTVNLWRNDAQTEIDPGFADVEVVANVTFGAGMTRQTISVDWLSGAAISLVAETITVEAHYTTTGDPSTRTPIQMVAAQLSPGTRPGHAQAPQRTIRLGTVAPAATARATIPTRAIGVQLLTDVATGYGGYAVEIDRAPSGNTLARWVPASISDLAPLPLGARSIQVTNGRITPDQLTLLFRLDA